MAVLALTLLVLAAFWAGALLDAAFASQGAFQGVSTGLCESCGEWGSRAL